MSSQYSKRLSKRDDEVFTFDPTAQESVLMNSQKYSVESGLTVEEIEVVRAEVTRQEFTKDTKLQSYSYYVLAMLMLVQVSSLWTKFIIGAAYNFQGAH